VDCDQCKEEIKKEEKYFTAIGMYLCEKCNEENNGCINLDFVLEHIRKHGDVAESG
jgi:hypothetical protein